MAKEEITVKNPIDIEAIIKLCLSKKWLYVKVCSVTLVLGIVIVFSIPRYYNAEVKLAPEDSNPTGSSTLGAIAAMANMKSASGSDDAIYPALYPQLFSSSSFLVTLFDIQVFTKNEPQKNITLSKYLLSQKTPWWGVVQRKLTKMVVSLRYKKKRPSSGRPGMENVIDPFWMNELQTLTASAIQNSVSCDVDRKTDVITLKTTAQDPVVAALMADSIMAHLQDFIIEYRTQKARGDVLYNQKLVAEAKAKYEKAKSKYAAFADSHDEISLPSYQTEMDDLENEMQLNYNSYSQLLQQLDICKAKVQERTPVFTTIESATVPLLAAGPHRISTLFLMIILAIVGTSFWIFLRKGHYKQEESKEEKKKD